MNARNDPLAELLVQLAGNAAALIEKAKAAQATRTTQTVDGEAVRSQKSDGEAVRSSKSDGEAVRPDPKEASNDPGDTQPNAQQSALQDIIVQQAIRLHTLEAEVARLTAALAAAETELATTPAATPPSPRPKPKPKAKPTPKPKPAG